jgi:hypothetical protein
MIGLARFGMLAKFAVLAAISIAPPGWANLRVNLHSG